ncbi:hypothetical protein [Mycobacterium neglectum]|uniref:hypothetical protein n=1 Tax=Mycobacterium neglectum TaxID=242737 RepID=UPI001145EE87|nr:hypothetical protein [Mycobacterium neglectum]
MMTRNCRYCARHRYRSGPREFDSESSLAHYRVLAAQMIEALPRVLISQTRYRGTDLVKLVLLLDVLKTPARNSQANLQICNVARCIARP